jgi:hypothetical protein
MFSNFKTEKIYDIGSTFLEDIKKANLQIGNVNLDTLGKYESIVLYKLLSIITNLLNIFYFIAFNTLINIDTTKTIQSRLSSLENVGYIILKNTDSIPFQIQDSSNSNVLFKIDSSGNIYGNSLYINNRSSEAWAGTLLTKYKNIKNACLSHLRVPSKTEYEYIENGGWHFTFMGGEEQIKLKLESYGHQEYNNDGIKNKIKDLLEEGKDVLGRNEFKFWIDESELPKYLIDNKNKYRQYFK